MTGGADCSLPFCAEYRLSVIIFIFPVKTATKRNGSGRVSCHFRVESTVALAQAPRSINYHLILVVSVCKELKLAEIIGNFLKSGGLCRPTMASGLVAIKVIWAAIRQRPFDFKTYEFGWPRLLLQAFSRKYYKMCPCRRRDIISTAAH